MDDDVAQELAPFEDYVIKYSLQEPLNDRNRRSLYRRCLLTCTMTRLLGRLRHEALIMGNAHCRIDGGLKGLRGHCAGGAC